MGDENEPLIKPETSKSGYQSYGGDETDVKVGFRPYSYGASSVNPRTVPQEERITYSWSEINAFAAQQASSKSRFFFFKQKGSRDADKQLHILKNVSGIAYPGELLAILGSSGAGKTTLLNALTFRSSKRVNVTGIRCVNGIPVNPNSLTSQSAYVQQDDLFIGTLTVKEHLTFQALVRMDKTLGYYQRMKRVDEVISELGLYKCKDTRIGVPGKTKGISGGEMKRLSFAAEVLTNPSLMFCDEPTSGLDSFMALNVIQVLKSMAQTGKTVICTIHQPSSELYSMFDKLLLMAEGRVAFLGTPAEAAEFFSSLEAPCPNNYNPADFYIQLLAMVPGQEDSSKNAITMICDSFSKSEFGVKMCVEAASLSKSEVGYDFWMNGDSRSSPYKASWWSQFKAVLWRSWLSVMKEPLLIKVRVLQTIMVSLLVSALYFGQTLTETGVMNINGALFIFLTNMTFQNVFAVINVFSSELQIFLREHRNGMYRTDVYFICKTLAEMPLFTFIPLVFTGITYYLIGLNPALPRFFTACGIVILVANAAISFGYMISCASSSLSMALSVGPPIIIPFLLFGGFFLNVSSIPTYFKWLSYFSWFKYGNEALLVNQWDGIENISCDPNSSTCPASGNVVLEMYNFSQDNFIMDILQLVLIIVFFRTLAFFALLAKAFRTE